MNWFYLNCGQQIGPVSLQELTNLASTGEIHPTTLVWKQGMSGWQPARMIGELASIHFGRMTLEKPKSQGKWNWLFKPAPQIPTGVRIAGMLLVIIGGCFGFIQMAERENSSPTGQPGVFVNPQRQFTNADLHARVRIGMTKAEVRAAIGNPENQFQHNDAFLGMMEVWRYGNGGVTFFNDRVHAISTFD